MLECKKAGVLDDLSPKDLYWDPRYKQYFFVGNLKPLPGDAHTGATVTSGADAASTVELVPTARTRKPSILVTEERRSEARAKRRGRWRLPGHISWTAYMRGQKAGQEAALPQDVNASPSSSHLIACSCALCAFTLLLVLTIGLWVSGALDDVARAVKNAETVTPADSEDKHAVPERYPKYSRFSNASTKLGVSVSLKDAASLFTGNATTLLDDSYDITKSLDVSGTAEGRV